MDSLVDAARGYEADRYLAALLTDGPVRRDLLAVAAFCADLRRITTSVKEPGLGEIRLQWWRDFIETIGATAASGNVIADQLAATAGRRQWPNAILADIVEARTFDLYSDNLPDERAFEGYLAKTDGAAFTLALSIVGAEAPDAAAAAGRSYGIARLLAFLPSNLARGRLALPVSLLTAHGVSVDSLLAGETSAATRHLFDDLATRAMADFTIMRQASRALHWRQRVALLPAATIPAYLTPQVLRGLPRTQVEVSPMRRIWGVTRAHWLGI